jgi:gas vesicle protein
MKKNNLGLVVLVGAISAIVALLFAPKSGKELRQDIKDKSLEARDNVQDGKNQLVSDFKQSYFEAADEVETELAHLDNRQRELNQTIASIEDDLRK